MTMIRTSTVQSDSNQICEGPNAELMVRRGHMALGEYGRQYYYGPQRVVKYEDDFEGGGVAFSSTVNAAGWRSRKGSDAACVDWTVTPAVNGTVVGTIGNTTASMAVSGIQLDRGLSYKANQGDLVCEWVVKMSVITNIAVYVGLTDQTAALEMPIQSAASANTITTNATDAVGFMFDTSMTTQDWFLVGVANDVDATLQDSTIAPVANTFAVLRVEVSTAGAATFWINGTQVGTTMTGAVTPTIALTPVVAAFNRTTSGAPTVTADYFYISADRA